MTFVVDRNRQALPSYSFTYVSNITIFEARKFIAPQHDETERYPLTSKIMTFFFAGQVNFGKSSPIGA